MSSVTEHQPDPKLIGVVKWFNNKSGYGFITVMTHGEYNKKDVFVHHSSLKVTNMYKYLVQGEYVELDLEKIENKTHSHQGVNIKGILGGDLMCECRNNNRDATKHAR